MKGFKITDSKKIETLLVDITIRPVKVLWCLSQDRITYFEKISSLISRFWGGIYHSIVPLQNGDIQADWVSYVSKYDPDFIILVSNKDVDKNNFIHWNTVNILTDFELAEIKKKLVSSTYGLGMNLQKLFSMTMPLQFTDAMEPLNYYYAALANPPSVYIDYDNLYNAHEFFFTKIFSNIEALMEGEDAISSIVSIFKQSLPLKYKEILGTKNQTNGIYHFYDLTTKAISEKITVKQGKISIIWPFHLLIVIGSFDDVKSLCLFWNLRSHYKAVIWIENTHVENLLKSEFIMNIQYLNTICLISSELDRNELEAIKDRFLLEPIDIRIIEQKDLSFIPDIKYFWKDKGHMTYPTTIVNRRLRMNFNNVDQFLDEILANIGHLSFCVEISLSNYGFPSRNYLLDLISKYTHCRTTVSNNLALYFSNDGKSTYNFSQKPIMFDIKLPSPFEVINEVCKQGLKEKFKEIRLSAAGRFNHQLISIAGSLTKIGELISDPSKDAIIRCFIIREKGKNSKIDLPLTDIINLVVKNNPDIRFEENLLEESIEELLVQKLIFIGLKLKCPTCRQKDWYPLKTVEETFLCSRCLSKSALPLKPRWEYRLNELVFQAFSQNTLSTLKALLKIKSNSKHFEYITEFEILYLDESGEEKTNEIDFFAIKSGKLIIGEAKSSLGYLKEKDITKYEFLLPLLKPDILYIYIDHQENKKIVHNNKIQRISKFCKENQIRFDFN